MRARVQKNVVPVRLREEYQNTHRRSEMLEKERSRKLHKAERMLARREKNLEREVQEIFRRAQKMDLQDTAEIDLHLNAGPFNSLKRKSSYRGRGFKP